MSEGYVSPHADFCGWHVDQFPSDCDCGAIKHDSFTLEPQTMVFTFPTNDHDTPATDDGHTYDNRGEGLGRVGNWQQVFTGIQFWPLDPRAEEVDIRDIAHALSMQCRYAGHCERFYSVAEHSVHVSRIVPPELALVGLLHDATEAYCIDVPRPLKPSLTGYKAIEDRIWLAIAERFGLDPIMPQAIKDADNAVLLAEAAQIMKPHPMPWCVPGDAADVEIGCWSPKRSEVAFLGRFYELVRAA